MVAEGFCTAFGKHCEYMVCENEFRYSVTPVHGPGSVRSTQDCICGASAAVLARRIERYGSTFARFPSRSSSSGLPSFPLSTAGKSAGERSGEGDGDGDGEACTSRLPNAVMPAAPTVCEFRISLAVANVRAPPVAVCVGVAAPLVPPNAVPVPEGPARLPGVTEPEAEAVPLPEAVDDLGSAVMDGFFLTTTPFMRDLMSFLAALPGITGLRADAAFVLGKEAFVDVEGADPGGVGASDESAGRVAAWRAASALIISPISPLSILLSTFTYDTGLAPRTIHAGQIAIKRTREASTSRRDALPILCQPLLLHLLDRHLFRPLLFFPRVEKARLF